MVSTENIFQGAAAKLAAPAMTTTKAAVVTRASPGRSQVQGQGKEKAKAKKGKGEMRDARCEMRDAKCELRGASCELRVTSYEVRVVTTRTIISHIASIYSVFQKGVAL